MLLTPNDTDFLLCKKILIFYRKHLKTLENTIKVHGKNQIHLNVIMISIKTKNFTPLKMQATPDEAAAIF